MAHLRTNCRGSIYVVVLGMSMLIAVIGLGAIYAGRVEVHKGKASADFTVARLCARAGLEIAMFRIQSDPNWRTDLGNGAWFSNIPLSQGTYSMSAIDPITGDITLPSNHPVILTSTGVMNSATYQMQLEVQVNQPALTCVNVSLCGGNGVTLNHCALTSTQTVEANGNFNADPNSTVNATVQATGNIGPGGTYTGTKQTISQALVLPDTTHVFDYYNANGTAIPYTALLQQNNAQIVNNPSFETNAAGWYVYSPSSGSVTISRDSTQHQDGQYALMVSGRNGVGDVPAQDLPALSVRNGDVYSIQVPVYASAAGNLQATIVIQSSAGTQSFSTPSVALKSNGGWVTAQGNVTLAWTGTLTKATLTLTCTNTTANLDIDKVSLTDTSLPGNAYVMDRVVLSPNSNPYGSTNAQGIYILNCNGQSVTIGPCRIVGTLILVNQGNNTTIQGPIIWEPAVPGYPAVLSDNALTISMNGSVGLSEATYGINFNPSGTPYPYVSGTSNTTASDGYTSIINGLIYANGNVTLNTSPTINGSLISAGQVTLNATSASFTYSNASYLTPPPGFSTSLAAINPWPGTWQRVTH